MSQDREYRRQSDSERQQIVDTGLSIPRLLVTQCHRRLRDGVIIDQHTFWVELSGRVALCNPPQIELMTLEYEHVSWIWTIIDHVFTGDTVALMIADMLLARAGAPRDNEEMPPP